MAKLPYPISAQATSDRSSKKPRKPGAARKAAPPRTVADYKALGQRLRDENKLDEARRAFQTAVDMAPRDMQALLMLGFAEMSDGDYDAARPRFEQVLAASPDDPDAHQGLGTMCYVAGLNVSALHHIEKTLAKKPHHKPSLMAKTQVLTRMSRLDEAAELCKRMIQEDPDNAVTHWNDLGNIHRSSGNLLEAEKCYAEAATFTKEDPAPLSNRLTLMHYMPERTPEQILEACKDWARHFAPDGVVTRPVPADLSPGRTLRVGMFSDGFRQHPVGAMTTTALEHLVRMGVELYLYTTHGAIDDITQRLMAIATRWTNIANVRDEPLAQCIREDKIDILMDLSGHNAGNRTRTMVLQPAPILVKWVGGLINTTGIESIDYLLTDSIESPPGSDSGYSEKLIRMPDDYICYVPPQAIPPVGPLPAQANGYITFGCFNNPTKINDVLLAEWAKLMHAVPDSRLYLKGGAFATPATRDRILGSLEKHGIDAARVRIEGQVAQYVLLDTYNQIDVALDPWPYSGGLTTCESMLMGVPVVTLPGPTFAGRHSATHLINAGMPELVTDNWDQYRARVLDLVGNLDSLATIRSHLRRILLESPVCDGARFARNLADALRATWQRYCAGKAPAALAFTPDGQPWFEDEDGPLTLDQPEETPIQIPAETADNFAFSFQGRIVTLDHGAAQAASLDFAHVNQHGVLEAIVIDPTATLTNADIMRQSGQIAQYLPHMVLGNGKPALVHACLDARLSGTMPPLPPNRQLPFLRQGSTVLAKLPINTSRLDDIDGLTRVDWLTLSGSHDNVEILLGAQQRLAQTLVVQIEVIFPEIYENQTDLTALGALLRPHGLRLLRMDQARYGSYLPETLGRERPGSQLLAAHAIFVPDEARLSLLDDNQRLKLAFLLYSAYGAADFAHRLLAMVDADIAERFLLANGWKKSVQATAISPLALQEQADSAPPPVHVDMRVAVRAPALALRGRLTSQRAFVGVPVYNEEKYIEQTIRSLKEQDADGVAFLIADNASTDRTLEIVRDVAAGDARFEIHSQESNRGAAFNFTFALEATDSDYFMWLGGHDYLSPDYLSRMIERLDSDRGVSMAFGMPHSVMNGKTAFLGGAMYDFSSPIPAQRYADSAAQLNNCTIIHSLFRREHVQDFPIRETLSGDHVLISHLLWKGSLAYVDGPKYFRRFFETRNDTAAERITGKRGQKLSRTDFYNYYRDDLAGLAGDTLGPKVLDKLQADLGAMLRKRFS